MIDPIGGLVDAIVPLAVVATLKIAEDTFSDRQESTSDAAPDAPLFEAARVSQ